jgi:hypothetical protein
VAYRWLRFGRIDEVTMSVDGGMVSEAKMVGRFGRTVGYWAYGYYDPAYPYQGDPLFVWVE